MNILAPKRAHLWRKTRLLAKYDGYCVQPGRDEGNKKKEKIMKKALRQTQTLRASRSKAEPKNFSPPQTPFPGRRTAKI